MVGLREEYNKLKLLPDPSPSAKRLRGHAFEKFLEALLADENLNPRIRLRHKGEEIDGSFILDQRIYLLEAKWHGDPLPASTIYAFKGKVDGKLVGTIGVFVSVVGYSKDAIDALTAGKVINVILMDGRDIEACTSHGFSHVLRVKLRAATEEGVVFYPFTSMISTVSDKEVTEETEVPTDGPGLGMRENQIVLLCESHLDTRVLSRLGQRILARSSLSANLRLIAAQGKQSIPRIANAIYPFLPDPTPLIIVVDGDRKVEETKRAIRDQVRVPVRLIIVNPVLEVWFDPGADQPKTALKEKAQAANQTLAEYLDQIIERLDLDRMMKNVPSFKAFYSSIVEAASRHGKK